MGWQWDGWAAAALVGCALTVGCSEPAGELDADVVHDIARTPGDAIGLDRSGEYDAELTAVQCDCPDLGTLEGISLCQGSGPISPMPGDKIFVTIDVVQTDGIILIRYDGQALTGGLDADGSFAAGGLFDMDTLVTTGEIITRMDGEFDDEASTNAFDATIKNRLHGDAAAGLGEGSDRTSLDCVETFSLDATGR
ncbi:MAG: hypothetical protein AAF721_31285 [Myxococcota bacterium]